MIGWTFFGIAFLVDWNKNWPFPALWTLLFSKFADILNAALSQPNSSGFLSSSAGIPSPFLSLFVVMLPKSHLTSYSSISGFTWVAPASFLSRSLWLFFYSSSVHSSYLFLISSASVRSLNFLSFIVPILAWSVPLVAPIFLKRSMLFTILLFSSNSCTVDLHFLISPCYSLEFCIPLCKSFPVSFVFHFSIFSAVFKASSGHPFSFSHLFFLGMVLVTTSRTMLQTSIHSSSGYQP